MAPLILHSMFENALKVIMNLSTVKTARQINQNFTYRNKNTFSRTGIFFCIRIFKIMGEN